MKLLIIFATSAVLLQYHSSIQTELPKELENYELQGKCFIDGGVSDVELAKNKQTGKEVVIKITSKIKGKKGQSQNVVDNIIKMARKEGDILKHLPPHRYIIHFEHFVETAENLYLVMEYASHGTVQQYLEVFDMDENTARFLFEQVVEAVQHCHQHGIVHRDLKLENLLFDSKNNIKLIDFGFAHKLKQGELLKEYSSSSYFSAPEVKTSKQSKSEYDGFKSDIWTLGVVLYELVCKLEWPGTDDFIVSSASLKLEKLLFPSNVPVTEDVKDLIRNILKIDPNERFSLQQIMDHKWMKMGGSNIQSG